MYFYKETDFVAGHHFQLFTLGKCLRWLLAFIYSDLSIYISSQSVNIREPNVILVYHTVLL